MVAFSSRFNLLTTIVMCHLLDDSVPPWVLNLGQAARLTRPAPLNWACDFSRHFPHANRRVFGGSYPTFPASPLWVHLRYLTPYWAIHAAPRPMWDVLLRQKQRTHLGKQRDHKSNFIGVVPHLRRDEPENDEVFEGGGVVLGNEMDDVFQQGVALLLVHLQVYKHVAKKTDDGEGFA